MNMNKTFHKNGQSFTLRLVHSPKKAKEGRLLIAMSNLTEALERRNRKSRKIVKGNIIILGESNNR